MKQQYTEIFDLHENRKIQYFQYFQIFMYRKYTAPWEPSI